MATFGWAYVDCEDSGSGGQAAGPPGSVQFLTGSNATSGSSNFLFHTASYLSYTANTLILTGTLIVTGAISASHFHIEDIATIDATGSTFFGNSTDDVHVRTGSFFVGSAGSVSASLEVDVNTQQVRVDGFRGGYRAITSDNTTSSATAYIYGVGVAGDIDFRLHAAETAKSGSVYVIKDEISGRTGAITVRASGSQTIDGASTYELSGSYPAISLYSNGANWFVF